jgi:DNA-binding transcriptional LysR family regulator
MVLSPISDAEAPYLGAFYAVCTEGGFSAAARKLGVTQPAISYQVRALEKALGTRLIERAGRRPLLTPAGERVRALSERFFADLARLRAALAGIDATEPLRLASASGFGRYVLVPGIQSLRAKSGRRGPELRLWFDSATAVLDSLERGECEAAFVYTRRESNRLRYRAVYDEELVLIDAATKRPRFSRAELRSLATFERAPFVTYEEGDYVFGRWFGANFDDQPSGLTSTAYFSELEEVIAWVSAGAGMSIVPRDSAEPARARGEIRIVYAGGERPCINQVFMALRSDATVRPEVDRIANAIKVRQTSRKMP